MEREFFIWMEKWLLKTVMDKIKIFLGKKILDFIAMKAYSNILINLNIRKMILTLPGIERMIIFK
jgi:hypothetical protein